MTGSCEKEQGEAKKARVNYLFSGYCDDSGELVGKVKPLPDVTFFSYNTVQNKESKTVEIDLVPMISNYNGAINRLKSTFEEFHRIRELTRGDNIEAKAHNVIFNISFYC